MPETARLTKQAQDMLSDIKDTYDVNVSTSEILELAISDLYDKKVGDKNGN